jgi:putative CocE/NonD family hydrolase
VGHPAGRGVRGGALTLASEIVGRRLGLPRPETRDLLVERDLEVPMPDGVVLLADRYAPKAGPPRPTLLVRSPYGRRGVFGLLYGRLFAERGIQAVVQSVRGTFGSGGEFNPFDERADGLATIAWLERQPWYEGHLGMTGSSYLGLTQWAVARDAGDSLDALTPSVTASQFYSQAYGGGSIALATALSWVVIVAAQQRRFATLRMLLGLRRLPPLLDTLPLGELDALTTGRPLGFYAEWLRHSAADDPYWVARDYSAGVNEVRAPVQLVGGWYDIFLPWMLEDHAVLEAAGRGPQLVVGPWTHTSPGLLVATMREALAWLRAHMLGDRRLLNEAPVRVFLGGAREWRELPAWPPPGARPLRLHLQGGGGLGPAVPADSPPDRYRYDPASPTPSLGGPVLLERAAVVDNRPLEVRDDVLTYTSEPLEADLDVIGPVTVELHARSSLDHFDLFARVCDVQRSGLSLNVTDAIARIAPDGSFERGSDGVTRVAFSLWPTAHRFAAGHRLRLQVSSGAHPRYARNPGTGEDPATASRLLAADQEVFHDPAHASALTLSVMEGSAR